MSSMKEKQFEGEMRRGAYGSWKEGREQSRCALNRTLAAWGHNREERKGRDRKTRRVWG